MLLLCAAVFLIACGNQPGNKNGKLDIAVSSYVAYTLAHNVLGNLANLTLLIPPGTEAHAFEPTPATIKDLKHAQFFFYTSNILEPWALKLDRNAIMLARNLPEVLEQDPHVWMSFDNAQVMAQHITESVVKQYPAFKTELNKNYQNFSKDIEELKANYFETLSACQNRTIYHVGHLAFGYIARDYGLNFKALFSADMDQEPSAKEISLLVKAIKESGAKYIFSEEQLNPALANTIAKETGAKILMLNTIEGVSKTEFNEGKTYQELMYENLENLKIGLECQGEDE